MHSAGHGLWPRRARPACAALARSTALAGRSACGPRARPWPSSASARRRVAHGARRRCSASWRRLSTGARRRRGSGGSPARKRRRGVTATGDGRRAGAARRRQRRRLKSDIRRMDTAGRGGSGAREAAVGGAGERSGCRGEREARSGGRVRQAGQLSGAALSRQRFKLHCRRGAGRPRGSGALLHGPGMARDG
jgi:hypothetical protein